MSHPLLNAFWMMLWFFLWVLWLMLLFHVIVDVFRDRNLSGWGKAAWTIFVCVLPFLGVFVYLIARGSGMAERSVEQAREEQKDFDDYVKKTAGTAGATTDDLSRLAGLRADGTLSEEEFQRAKQKILA
jgi:hypothetical protein